MSSHHWRNGSPTTDGIVTFAEGDCWILAYFLWRETGWPIYLVDAGVGVPTSAQHWVVRVPGQDRYLDVTGVSTRRQLLREWQCSSLIKANEDCYEFLAAARRNPKTEWFDNSWRRAPIMARRLLEKYGIKEDA